MSLVGVAHLYVAVGKVLGPAAGHERGCLGIAEELFRVRRFDARVDDDRRGVGQVVAFDLGRGGVDICRRLKAGEGRPQEIDGAGSRALGLIGEHHQRPTGKGRMLSKA